MPKTELEKLEVFRLSGRDANRITRECVQAALMLLMEQKPFEEITVTELTRQAGVSRTAYYHTYKSKDQVLADLIADMVQVIAQVLIQEQDMRRRNLLIFQKTGEYGDMLRLLLRAHFGDRLLTGLTDYTLALLPKERKLERLRMVFWCGAYYNVLQYWLLDEEKASAEEISERFEKIYGDPFTELDC